MFLGAITIKQAKKNIKWALKIIKIREIFGESNKTFASSLTKIIKNIQKKQIKQ